jgi:chemotaxis protein CheD
VTKTVRMGEMAVSASADDELVARGLGSCIGLALVDRLAGVAGLAHIVLPESSDGFGAPGRFADRAVPGLIAELLASGAIKRRLEAVLVGGAHMFDKVSDLNIGSRNEAAVRHGLSRAGVSIRAAATGGNMGRTVRVAVSDCAITMNEAGSAPVTLLPGATTPPRRSSAAGAPRSVSV